MAIFYPEPMKPFLQFLIGNRLVVLENVTYWAYGPGTLLRVSFNMREWEYVTVGAVDPQWILFPTRLLK